MYLLEEESARLPKFGLRGVVAKKKKEEAQKLNKSDLHAIEQTLLVQRGNELRELFGDSSREWGFNRFIAFASQGCDDELTTPTICFLEGEFSCP